MSLNSGILRRWGIVLLSWFVTGCGEFQDTVDHGVPNLTQVNPADPSLWRSGQPANAQAWRFLMEKLGFSNVTVIKLNDEVEGKDDLAEQMGWKVIRVPIPPEDDKPWTILVMPKPSDVHRILATIVVERMNGRTVLIHCSHGRDRTGLISALVGMILYGWSKMRAWRDMIDHGFRWELPDLAFYWAKNVP